MLSGNSHPPRLVIGLGNSLLRLPHVDGSPPALAPPNGGGLKPPTSVALTRSQQLVSMSRKSVFQVHGVDADGQVVVRRQLKRRYVLAFFRHAWLASRLAPRRGRVSCSRLVTHTEHPSMPPLCERERPMSRPAVFSSIMVP